MRDKRVNVKVSLEEKETFEAACNDNNSIPSLVIRELMKEYIRSGNDIFTK